MNEKAKAAGHVPELPAQWEPRPEPDQHKTERKASMPAALGAPYKFGEPCPPLKKGGLWEYATSTGWLHCPIAKIAKAKARAGWG